MDDLQPNQVARLTPPGMAAVATIRLTGPNVRLFCEKHLSRKLSPGRCVHVELKDGDDLIDDPLAVLIAENTLDLSLHGSTWIVQRTIDLAAECGFEFVESESMFAEIVDEIEKEVIRDLPRALTQEAIKILLAQPVAWREMMSKNDQFAKAHAAADRSLRYLLNPPTVAIVGVPNVGKSTLANQLFARDHSITADLPGTTRDWVGEQANIDGLVVTLIDTPGIRETADPIEAAAIAASYGVVREADLIIELFDATQPRSSQFVRYEKSIRVLNKVDSAGGWSDAAMIPISARTGAGLDQLRVIILKYFCCEELNSLYARAWTKRQLDLIGK